MAQKDCPGCRKRRRRVAELEALVCDLQARLGQHAGNSSLPPSANPPAAPPPVVKEPSGRQPGAQPGHLPCPRVRLPAERVRQVVHHWPTTCRGCGHDLPAEPGPHDPEPTWHPVAELPEITAVVTEHQGPTRTCPGGGIQTHAAIPADVRAHTLGPRLAAVMASLSGARHDRQRGVAEVVETVFGVPVALGTVYAVEQEISAALAPAHAEVAKSVQAAPVQNVDETGWKQSGQRCWLWPAVPVGATSFVRHTRRGLAGLTALWTRPSRACSLPTVGARTTGWASTNGRCATSIGSGSSKGWSTAVGREGPSARSCCSSRRMSSTTGFGCATGR